MTTFESKKTQPIETTIMEHIVTRYRSVSIMQKIISFTVSITDWQRVVANEGHYCNLCPTSAQLSQYLYLYHSPTTHLCHIICTDPVTGDSQHQSELGQFQFLTLLPWSS